MKKSQRLVEHAEGQVGEEGEKPIVTAAREGDELLLGR